MSAIAPTTGTISNLTYDSRTLVDRAYGLCKIRPQQIQGEMVTIAQTMLDLVFKNLVNTSAPLWTITKQLITLQNGQHNYGFPVGTNDVKSMFYRTMANVTPAVTSNTPSSFVMDFGPGTVGTVTSWQIQWAVPVQASFQASADGITWVAVNSTNPALPLLLPTQWYDLDLAPPARFWRVIPTQQNQSLAIVGASVYNTPNDILMARINEDSYNGMVNKTFTGRPVQYWLDRAINPIARVWAVPGPAESLNLMVARTQRYIFDVGNLTQSVELPARWFLAIMYSLGAELAWVTPEVDSSLATALEAKAAALMKQAWAEERDKSPFRVNVGIGVYTK